MKGIDISSYQGNVDFAAVKASGVEVVIIKASEGMTWKDGNFTAYYDGARIAGLKVGAYHFLRANETESEVRNFLDVIGDRKFDCKLVIDMEIDYGSAGTNSALVRRFADSLIAKGFEVCLYTGEYFYNYNLNDTVKDLPLWVAKYSSTAPSVGREYIGWQYASTGSVPGIGGNVDMNDFGNCILLNAAPQPAPQAAPVMEDIVQLQMLLNQAGIRDYEGKELVCDGIPGERTLSALKKCVFRKGDKDALIAWIQRKLGIPDDCDFGPQTERMIISFQFKHLFTADGIVGINTWRELVK